MWSQVLEKSFYNSQETPREAGNHLDSPSLVPGAPHHSQPATKSCCYCSFTILSLSRGLLYHTPLPLKTDLVLEISNKNLTMHDTLGETK